MLIAQRPTLTEEVVDDVRSRFVIEPLEPGFGYTLGNSLRRTLLSSIPGAAVTSIRIDGVLHEFTTIPGVKEDVTDLILNIKNIVVSSEHDEPVTMYLRKQGPVRSPPPTSRRRPDVEVHNPDLHLATLNGKGKLEMELTVERGRGYVSAVQNKQPGQEIGRIPVDSIYSPVLKVTYKVEATRVEQRTDFDRLIVDVETKGPCCRATRWPAPARRWSSCSAGPRAERRGRGHRHGPVADRRRAGCRPGVADRGARPHRPVVQLPQARGHPHRGRAGRAQRGGPARHPQLRRRSPSTRSRPSSRRWDWRSRTVRPGSTRALAVDSYADDDDQVYAETEQY